jgi:hypothetical protein
LIFAALLSGAAATRFNAREPAYTTLANTDCEGQEFKKMYLADNFEAFDKLFLQNGRRPPPCPMPNV